MAVTRKRLVTPALLPNSSGLAYTVPDNTKCKDIELHFTNTDTSTSIGVTVYFVEAGGSAGGSNTFLMKEWFILSPYESRPWGTDQALNAGDKIYWLAGTASKIAGFITGSEIV
jgi:hypothetical protein